MSKQTLTEKVEQQLADDQAAERARANVQAARDILGRRQCTAVERLLPKKELVTAGRHFRKVEAILAGAERKSKVKRK